MTAHHIVKLTANFERTLDEIEVFSCEGDARRTFDALLDELTDTVISNLERFPGMGRSFPERLAHSVETRNGIALLTRQLKTLAEGSELREYLMTHYLLLYARIKNTVYLLSIRHHRQLSFDLASHWPT